MKIIIVDTTLHGPLIGGAQTFLPVVIKGLNRLGHEIHLVAAAPPDPRIQRQIQESGAILHTALWNKTKLVEDNLPVFAEWINSQNPDIYIISVSADMGWVVLPFLKSSIATFTIGHTDDETFYAPARHYKDFLTGVIAVSDYVGEQYAKIAGIAQRKIHWIPYGVRTNLYPPSTYAQNVLKIIYVGRIDETQKRISDIISIALQLSAQKIPYLFNLVGDGPEMTRVRDALTKEIESGTVILSGWQDNDRIIDLLQFSEVFLLTSAYEGFCIALVEAMANGCCPIVTDIRSGNKQLIENGKSGFILPVGYTDLFVQKLKELQLDKKLTNQMRYEAWESGSRFNIERMVRSYEEAFQKAKQQIDQDQRITDATFPLMESCRSSYPLWARRIKKRLKL